VTCGAANLAAYHPSKCSADRGFGVMTPLDQIRGL
jgi:hypothetical protein